MTKLATVSKQTHFQKSFTRYADYEFAARDSVAPLVAAEISRAMRSIPMAFVKQQERYILVGILSPTPDQNLFVANGQWLGGYVPSVYRGYPFRLAKTKDRDELVLCVDEDSGLIHDDTQTGEAFFDENGELSRPVQGVMDFLTQIEKNRAVTDKAVAVLAETGVIGNWELKVKDGDQERLVNGLYKIDEKKLNNLDDQSFLKLRKAGALPIAYGQLLSMENVQVFAKLSRIHQQAAKPQTEPDIEKLFGEDDILSFDNI